MFQGTRRHGRALYARYVPPKFSDHERKLVGLRGQIPRERRSLGIALPSERTAARGSVEGALALVEEALQMDPNSPSAKDLKNRLEEIMERL
jgi:hypothetical protein